MKKWRFSFITIIGLAFLFTNFLSCKSEIETLKSGSISGVAKYENSLNHAGINITLVSTDGLVAKSVYRNATFEDKSVQTDESGNYSFTDIPEGVYTIYASSDSSSEKAIFTNVTVKDSETATPEVLMLTATGTIQGSITIDGQSTNSYGMDILVLGTSYSASTDKDGSYEISDVPAKEGYSLCVRKGNYLYIINDDITVEANKTTVIDKVDISSSSWNEYAFTWLGALDKAPQNPQKNQAYFNKNDSCSYIWNGSKWDLLSLSSKEGLPGKDGSNGVDGKDGTDGLSIIWKGELVAAPENPKLNWAYFNTTTGCSYIWNGKKWDMLAKVGANGEDGNKGDSGKDGSDGVDGLSIVWKGEQIEAPENPELNWAYYNLSDGNSYIWNGSKWDMLAKGNASHVHNFADWIINLEATEFIEGLRTATCADCNYEITQIIPKLEIPVVNPEPYTTRVENLNHIFNNQTLGTTTITMKRSEWNKLCDNYRFFFKNENYVHAEKYEYEKDGTTWSIPNVGFRQRGNTSRFCPQGVDNGRLQGQSNADWSEDYYTYAEQENDDYRQVHFKVDFEEFLEGDEELKMAGCMKGVALKRMDHSWGREIFCYDLFHKYGIWTAPRASHTRVILKFIEDETDNSITTVDYGVYEMFEEVNKQSLKARAQGEGETASNLWANNKGNLWKCSNDLTTGRMHETGVEDIRIIFDEDGNPIDKIWNGYSLDLKTNKDELASAETELHGFITDLNALPTDTSNESIATIKAFYEKWFDMDFFLKTYAINILCGMDDDYWGNANNFYLYFDTGKKGTGKLYFIPFDYDNTLGCSIKEGGFLQNPLEWGRGENRPLMDRMMLVPEYKQKFIDLLLEVSAEDSYWNFERCSQQFLDWKAMLEPHAASPDLHDKISQKYWGDYTWQPGGYSLTNYSNNIFDATRYAISGEENPNIINISEVECSDGIKIAINKVPEETKVRKIHINNKNVSEFKYNEYEGIFSKEFYYPYTKAGETYSIKIEYCDEDYSAFATTNSIEITAKGGRGELYTKEPFTFSYENGTYTFPSETVKVYDDYGEVTPFLYAIGIFTKDWNYIKGSGEQENYIQSFDVGSEYDESEIMFQYYIHINENDTVNGPYRYYFNQPN